MSKATSLSGEAAGGTTRGVALSGTARRVMIYLGIALVVFLLGLVPMWLKAREAVIDARRGEYETARQTASDFFTTLRSELDAGSESPLNPRQREAAAPLLNQRDPIITLLARGDPASAERLSDLYVSYRAAVNDVPNR